MTPQELEYLFRNLKVSYAEIHLLLYYVHVRSLYDKPTTNRVEWVAAYAHPDALLCRQVYAASECSEEQRSAFLAYHEQQTTLLTPHILRYRERRTLLTASDLFALGEQQGLFLGRLLREGERLAIEQDLHDSASVLAALQATELWKTRKK